MAKKLTSGKAKEILKDGTAYKKPLTSKQKRYFGWVAGGSKAEDGASIEPISRNMFSGPIHQFHGPAHSEGGIDIQYGGQPVEVEGGETSFVDHAGDMHVMGNMNVPGSKKKFKDIFKGIAEKENKAQGLIDKGSKLVNENDPMDKWGRLKFNSGNVMMQGGTMKQKELSGHKEHLAQLQKAILDVATEKGYDPQHLSQGKIKMSPKAKWGYAADGASVGGGDDNSKKKQSLAQRNNNPGNIEYGPWAKAHGAVPGDSYKGKIFAKFPDVQSGQQAIKNLLKTKTYQGKTVDDAIKSWTGGQPYDKSLWKDIAGKKISDLNPQEQTKLYDAITKGEDSKAYNWSTPSTPPSTNKTALPSKQVPNGPDLSTPEYDEPTPINPNIPNGPGNSIPTNNTPNNPDKLTPTPYTIPPTNAKGLGAEDFLPEAYAAANNRLQDVRAQKFEPQLYTPYEVSFQDRLNEDNKTFNALRQGAEQSPGVLSQLAAQKYNADNSVLGEQFRTNQGIKDDIINKNTAILNDAENKNLQIADQQYVRQSEAQSKTKEQNQAIVNSISDKYAKNKLEQQEVKAYEARSKYRFDKNGQLVSYNPPQNFGFNTAPNSQNGPGTSESVTYDASGNPIRTNVRTKTPTEQEYDEGKVEQQGWDRRDNLAIPSQKYGGKLSFELGGVAKTLSATKKLRW
jgi:hypothetical protein